LAASVLKKRGKIGYTQVDSSNTLIAVGITLPTVKIPLPTVKIPLKMLRKQIDFNGVI